VTDETAWHDHGMAPGEARARREETEWEVTVDPPVTVTADGPQQAADERCRLELETPADEDPNVKTYVRPAGTDDPWELVYPNLPPLTVDGGLA
jgi:hypothetical protein